MRPSSFEERFDVGVRVEYLQVVELLADADELHRQPELLLDGEDRPALGRAVKLGQDDASTLNRLLELLCLRDRVLAAGRVEDQYHLVGRAGNLLTDDAVD